MAKYCSMMLIVVLLILTGACTNSPSSINMEDWAKKRAEEFIGMLTDEEFMQAHSNFDQNLAQALPVEKIEAMWQDLTEKHGQFVQIDQITLEDYHSYYMVYATCLFEKRSVEAKIAINQKAEIAGLIFHPAGTLPDVSAQSFAEEEVMILNNEYSLPGVVTLPDRKGVFPAIIMVGSMLTPDRDGTLGPNKILRDIAWELAEKGIATLRYDRRSAAYPEYFLNNYEYTPEEDIADTVAAVRFLSEYDGIDPDALFLLGHGIGGTMSPRVVDRIPEIRGTILMAARARPLEEVLKDQYRYVYTMEEFTDEESVNALQSIDDRIELLENIFRGDQPAKKTMIFGLPISYWLDLHQYEPALYASEHLSVPILILQGERDYQTTVEDFQIWEDTLQSKEAEFKLYRDLNHMFIAGEGEITPAEYLIPGNVDQSVIDDISAWLKRIVSARRRVVNGI